MSGKAENSDTTSLRQQRDRFVAFAFASADLVFELGGDGKIGYAAGAMGRLAGDVLGAPFFDLLHEADRSLAKTLVASVENGGRISPVPVRLAKADGPLMMLGACGLPNRHGRIFVTLASYHPVTGKVEEKKVLDQGGFAEAAARKLAEADRPLKMTFVALDGQPDLAKRLPDEVGRGLFAAVEHYLQKAAGENGTAGALGEGRYGILSEQPFDAANFREEVATLSKSVDPLGKGMGAKIQSSEIDNGGLRDVDVARALMYCINDFVAGEATDLSSEDFKKKLDDAFTQVATRVVDFRSTISSGSFSVHYQPVVEIATGMLHHVEALARFGDGTTSPAETMIFAERMLLISDFDMAVFEKVMAELRANPDGAAVAVNLSGVSIDNAAFTDALLALLKENLDLAPRLLFEITESAAVTNLSEVNARMQALRGLGFHVCLDDFGAGANAFHYLRGLQADHVKIDGEFGLAALQNSQDRMLLVSVAQFCAGIGAELIAEKIEKAEEAEEFGRLGVRYGQGWFYGKAMPELPAVGTRYGPEPQKIQEVPLEEASVPARLGPRGPLNPGKVRTTGAAKPATTSALASMKAALR